MAARALVIAVSAAALAGCASGAVTAGGNTAPDRAPVPGGRPVPYVLYTHCGIDWESIGGRWFQAQPPLSDGNGNPPRGWGNPSQEGTLTMLSATRAEFRDAAGHRIILVLRSAAAGPKQLCS